MMGEMADRPPLDLQKAKKDRRRRGFLWGLLAGQIVILTLIFGGRAALYFLRGRVTFNPPIPLEALVFIGMVAGIAFTAVLIFFILGLQGAGYVMGGKKKAGFFTSVGRGIRRCFHATWALGLTLGVIGGTAWLLIPSAEREPTIDYVKDQGEKAIRKTKEWAEETLRQEPSEEDGSTQGEGGKE